MAKIYKMSNRAWYGFICGIVVMEVALIAAMIGIASWLTGKPFSIYLREVGTIILILLPVTVLFMLFIFRANKSNRPNKELARLENDFKKQLKIHIKNNFGKAQYISINPDLHQLDYIQSDLLKNLLSETSEDNKELRHYLYATIGLYCLKSDDLKEAVINFRCAIKQMPMSIICLAWLAETYELIGDSMNALEMYKNATMISEKTSAGLFGYFKEQINIVKNNGPRKSPPITGLRYGTF